MTPYPWLDEILRDSGLLLFACFLGGAVGWQREAQGRPAGLRTHVLVCVGSCLITLVSFGGLGDPGRIAAQIVSGIGFLGAGVILRRGFSVRGLTTAATIWVVAGIGLAVGVRGIFAVLAGVTTVLVLLTLTLAKRLEDALFKEQGVANLMITVPRHTGGVGRIMETLTDAGADIIGFEASDSEDQEQWTLTIALHLQGDVTRGMLTERLAQNVPDARFAWDQQTDS